MAKFNTIYSGFYSSTDCYPFTDLCDATASAKDVGGLKDATEDDALIIWGGSDIDPKFYKHPRSITTNTYGTRDTAEWALMQEAIKRKMTILGICRGAQMLCAAAGGFLLQDVRGHGGSHHDIMTHIGETMAVNSIHHQMMAGYEKVGHELLAWSKVRKSEKYVYKADELFPIPENWVEPEYIYFTDIKGHAVQWHPEGMNENSDATQFVLESIKER